MEYKLIPNEFFVGDEVELYCLLNTSEALECKSFNIEKIKKNDNITIKSLEVVTNSKESYLLLKFVPWQAGELALPSLESDTFTLKLPSVRVSSTLELDGLCTTTLQKVRGPILPLGTIYLLYKYIAFSIIIALLLISSFVFIKKKGSAFIKLILHKYAISIFYIKLVILQNKLKHIAKENQEDVKAWIKKYEIILKSFLFSIHKIGNDVLCNALTYSEIEEKVKNQPNSKYAMDALHYIFEIIKKLKFSNMVENIENTTKDLLHLSFNLIKLYKHKE